MTIKADFLTGHRGKYFLTQWPSVRKNSPLLIILQPFAEEQNRIRHLIRKLAESLQKQGWQILLPDNYGTGDSDGDLDTATTTLWREDLIQLLQMLRDDGFEQVSFIAIRFGCLQLFDLLNKHDLPLTPGKLILWQPMFDVAKFWQQFARIKVAEAMANGTKSSQKALEQQLDDGTTLEIAGYPISPKFYQSLQQMQCNLPAVLTQFTLSWFETSQLDNTSLPVQKMLQQLQQQQNVIFNQIKAEPYWQTAELASADTLIALTVQQFNKGEA